MKKRLIRILGRNVAQSRQSCGAKSGCRRRCRRQRRFFSVVIDALKQIFAASSIFCFIEITRLLLKTKRHDDSNNDDDDDADDDNDNVDNDNDAQKQPLRRPKTPNKELLIF